MEIEGTTFGTITIDGKTYEHDVIIRLSGEVVKRKKKLSKKYYGTSHVLSKDEAKFVFEKGCEQLILGTGQMGNVHLSPEAEAYFAKMRCSLALLCPAISWDVHALEVLRVDRLLHDAALLCFVDEGRECSLRRGRPAFRQRGRHANHRIGARHDLGARQGLSGRIPNTRVRPKDVRLAGAQQFGRVSRDCGA